MSLAPMPPRPTAALPLADRVQARVARWLGALPPRWQLRLAGEPPLLVDGCTADPGVQLVRALRRRRPVPGLCEPDPVTARARYRREMQALGTPAPPVGAVRDLTIPGPGGPLRARHYAPPAGIAEGAPLLVYYHGGGFVIGDLETHDLPCRLLCRDGAQHVLAVDYRLAPEHPFPAAPDDAHAAFRWARVHAAALGADPARVAVGGDSAGGNLAAGVALVAAAEAAAHPGDAAWAAPVAQLLIYPVTDGVGRWPSEALFDAGWFLSMDDRRAFARHYLGGVRVTPGDPRVAPLRAPSLAGLPPALVVTAGFDVLRDEGEAYAHALAAAGTPTRLLRVAGFGHGFVHLPTILPGARAAMRDVAAAWRAVLAAAIATSATGTSATGAAPFADAPGETLTAAAAGSAAPVVGVGPA